jgi:ABC-2 type transport system permease protein
MTDAGVVESTATARILDRGYRRYDGRRRGTRGAIRTVAVHSIQRALGLRRSAWAKVLPIGFVLLAYVPAIVYIGLVSLLPKTTTGNGPTIQDVLLPSYGEYLGYVSLLVALLVAFVAPEILCTDRRTGMVGLYLASPLTRDTYLVAKAAATAAVLSLITIGPVLLMLVAFIIQGEGPDGPLNVLLTILRIIGAGLVITALYTALSMGVSSLTDRKAFATVALILLFFLSNVVAGVLTEAVGLSENLIVVNIFLFPLALVERIHGESEHFPEVSFLAVVVAAVVWSAFWALVCRVRYAHLTVTK